MKVEDGRLEYNLDVLIQNHLVNNAYETLTKLLGIQENNGSLTLAEAETDCYSKWETYNYGFGAT